MIHIKRSDRKSRIELYKAIMSAGSINECADLLSDLLTERELDVIDQRFRIAKMLTENRSYDEINQATNASTATISQVSKTLLCGYGGYARAFTKINK